MVEIKYLQPPREGSRRGQRPPLPIPTLCSGDRKREGEEWETRKDELPPWPAGIGVHDNKSRSPRTPYNLTPSLASMAHNYQAASSHQRALTSTADLALLKIWKASTLQAGNQALHGPDPSPDSFLMLPSWMLP